MILVFTGHRPEKIGQEWLMRGPVSYDLGRQIAKILHELMPDMTYSGMALGLDMIAALTCIKNGYPVTAAIPCKRQDRMWPSGCKALYHQILANPLVTVHQCSNEPYRPDLMQFRNEWMVNQLKSTEDRLVAAWDGSPGGTKNCIEYAKFMKKEIIYLKINK